MENSEGRICTKIIKNSSDGRIEGREDRLSSLPDHILIRILSCHHPIQLAIVTECLSKRWRGLWKEVTRIDLDGSRFRDDARYDRPLNTYNKIIHQITSTFINSFSVDLRQISYWGPFIKDWLHIIFRRNNVRELKLIGLFNPNNLIRLPRFITQTQSLESIELSLSSGLQLPNDDDGSINLPNLRNLKLDFQTSDFKSLEKLIRACPSLEQLSLICRDSSEIGCNIKCTNHNLRRLIIEIMWHQRVDNIVIEAPTLESLAFRATKYVTICFDEEPVGLREMELEVGTFPALILRSRLPLFGSFNLPNLRNLKLFLWGSESLHKHTNSCSALDQSSLHFDGTTLKCSHQNLRQLIIEINYYGQLGIEISTPKLELLALRSLGATTICFDKEPIVLREAKINVFELYFPRSEEHKNEVMSTIFETIHNARVLELSAKNVVNDTISAFPNLNRLTLDMKSCLNIETVLTFVELCPVLDFLKLKFWDITCNWEETHYKLDHESSLLQRVLERIEIETRWPWPDICCQPAESFIDLIVFLLSNAIDLQHFHFSFVSSVRPIENVESKEIAELKLCRLLYQCPMVSSGCEVEFAGRYFNMSRKAGPKAWKENGEIVDLLSMDTMDVNKMIF